jgi:DNA-binding MarR family transcriptional regulator
MDRIACMQSFVRAIEMNSFSAVAREQQTTQPTISKQIAALEKYLGVQLLTRSTTNLSLTEEGKKVLSILSANFGNRGGGGGQFNRKRTSNGYFALGLSRAVWTNADCSSPKSLYESLS